MVERPAEVEESFSQAAPLVYHYGHTNMSINSTLYNTLISRMAEVIHQRMDDNPRSNFCLLKIIRMLYLSYYINFIVRKNILKIYGLVWN